VVVTLDGLSERGTTSNLRLVTRSTQIKNENPPGLLQNIREFLLIFAKIGYLHLHM